MLKPHTFFLFVGFIFGLSFLVFTPPFQVPDEVNHYYRAYHIASGHLFPIKQDNRLGGFVPKSLVKVTNFNLGIKGSPYTRTSFINLSEQFQLKLEDTTPEFVDFPNTALYTPISYLPQAISIAVFKNLGLRPVLVFYLTRLAMLFLWLYTVFYVIKILPIYKWFFVITALLPMSVFVNMSVSADIVTNLLGFLWIGVVFKLAFNDNGFKIKELFILLIIAILLASSKYVYTPVVFLLIIIPKSKFPKIRFLKPSMLQLSIILIAFLVAFSGSRYASKTYISNAAYNQTYVAAVDVPYGTDINAQIKYLKANPKKIIEVVYNAVDVSFTMLVHTYIGVLGWLDVRIPFIFVFLGYTSLFLVLLKENTEEKLKIEWWHRLLMLGIGSVLFFLVYLSQYLSWAGVGTKFCGVIQGRYFIPFMPLFFIGLVFFQFKRKWLLPVSIALSLIVLVGGLSTLYARFYALPNIKNEIVCSFESTFQDDYIGTQFFETNVANVVASNALSITTEKARSGTHSSKVSNESVYGATFKVYGYAVGDTLTAEVWYFGDEGNLWINSAYKNPYLCQNTPSETDANGWKKLATSIVIEPQMEGKEIGIFVEGHKVCYYDDFKLSVHKARKQSNSN